MPSSQSGAVSCADLPRAQVSIKPRVPESTYQTNIFRRPCRWPRLEEQEYGSAHTWRVCASLP